MVLGKKKQKSIRGKREERERTQSKYMTHLEKICHCKTITLYNAAYFKKNTLGASKILKQRTKGPACGTSGCDTSFQR